MARLIGLPGKGEMAGSKVAKLLADAVLLDREGAKAARDKVARYCLSDSLQTALIFLRTRAHTGKIDAAAHDFALASFEAREVAKEAGLEIDWARLKLSERWPE
jgi:hypothetical protein